MTYQVGEVDHQTSLGVVEEGVLLHRGRVVVGVRVVVVAAAAVVVVARVVRVREPRGATVPV